MTTLGTPTAARQTGEAETLLLFRCGGADLAVPVAAVERASYLVAVQQVPGASDFLVGISVFEGTTLPVIDLAVRLGLPAADAYTVFTPLLWCRAGERAAAMVVDEIVGVEIAPAAELTQLLDGAMPPLRGAVRHDGRLWLLLDIERVLGFDLAEAISDLHVDLEQLQQWMLEAGERSNDDDDDE